MELMELLNGWGKILPLIVIQYMLFSLFYMLRTLLKKNIYKFLLSMNN